MPYFPVRRSFQTSTTVNICLINPKSETCFRFSNRKHACVLPA
jgi:hypothetical protein